MGKLENSVDPKRNAKSCDISFGLALVTKKETSSRSEVPYDLETLNLYDWPSEVCCTSLWWGFG